MITNDIAKKVVDKFAPVLLHALLVDKKLDNERLEDREYLRDQIMSNLDLIDEMKLQFLDYDTYRDAMVSEISAGRKESSFVMAGTCIEHILNYFFQDVLSCKFGLNSKEVSDALSTINIPDKLGWFFKVTTEEHFPKDLRNKLLKINTIRNRIVHFKAIPENMNMVGGSRSQVTELIEQFPSEQLEIIIDQLEEEVEKTFDNLFPEYKLAHEIYDRYLR